METDTRYYFIDEAGDGVLFSRSGKVLVDTNGCSRFFILGLLEVPDRVTLKERFETLRTQLISDPYFKNVPSMQPESRKTTLAFHAKDDLPEIRREVFQILYHTQGLRFYAVVTDKRCVLQYVRLCNQREPKYRYHPNELYNYLTQHLFSQRIHPQSHYEIIFSKRGKSGKTDALRRAIEYAPDGLQNRGEGARRVPKEVSLNVSAATPKESAGLQAVDYFLWALQRFYERGEDRYMNYLWEPAFRFVHDLDDTRMIDSGMYWTQNNPLTLDALQERK